MISVEALLSAIVAIELAQLGVLASTWARSRSNQRRIRVLLSSLGIDPDDPPEFDVRTSETPRRTDGGERRDT